MITHPSWQVGVVSVPFKATSSELNRCPNGHHHWGREVVTKIPRLRFDENGRRLSDGGGRRMSGGYQERVGGEFERGSEGGV